MDTESDVAQFLQEFKAKKSIWGVRFTTRDINDETLLALNMSYADAERILDLLVPADYYQGPVEEKANMGRPMWVFRKTVKGQELYIKISLGDANKMARCFSFHFPVHPFKT